MSSLGEKVFELRVRRSPENGDSASNKRQPVQNGVLARYCHHLGYNNAEG